jgi:hypothetical protein
MKSAEQQKHLQTIDRVKLCEPVHVKRRLPMFAFVSDKPLVTNLCGTQPYPTHTTAARVSTRSLAENCTTNHLTSNIPSNIAHCKAGPA